MLKILRISGSGPQASSAPYNQFTLPFLESQDQITFCSFEDSKIDLPQKLLFYSAGNSVRKMYQLLKNKLSPDHYDVIHIHHLNVLILFLFVNLFRFSAYSKSIFTLHTSYHLLSLRNKVFFIFALISLNKIICCSFSSLNSVPGWIQKIFKNKLIVIENGFDHKRIDKILSKKTLDSKKNLRIISVGRLNDGKNPKLILEAFRGISNEQDAELVFIGDGALRNELEIACVENHLSNSVHFTGNIPRDEVFQWMNSSDIIVSASKGEGLPISILEAIYCGCYPILSKIPPHQEIEGGLKKSITFSPLDSENLLIGLRNFIHLNDYERESFKIDFSQNVKNKFSLERMLKAYYKLYDQTRQINKHQIGKAS